METRERKFSKDKISAGSALILTVVLTGMLAIVGVLFVMMARVDKVATSAISENRELDLAIETVIARISQELVSDIPGVAGQEYYDYPDPCNAWLASLVPELINDFGTADANDDIYKWPQISDITGFLRNRPFPFATQYVDVDPPGNRDVILDYPPIMIDHNNGQLVTGPQDDGRFDNEWRGQLADADGDGIADSKWVELYDVSSGKGKNIYIAVRVVDPGATANVNTGFRFDATDPCAVHIDGSSQMQINLAGLARPLDDINDIDVARSGSLTPVSVSYDWRSFQNNVIWRMEHPVIGYLPFDISDELELRYRYCITSKARTRLENVWNNTIGDLSVGFKDEPYSGGTLGRRSEWQSAVTDPVIPINFRRHLLTTYNVDRIIDARGGRMININNADIPVDIPYQRYSRLFPLYPLDTNTPVGILYDRLLSSLGPVIPDPNIVTEYAQLAANMIDFIDEDDINFDGELDANCVTTLVDPYGNVHYGFEVQPFITEIGIVLPGTGRVDDRSKPPIQIDPGSSSFAVELYNPFDCNIPLRDFQLELFNKMLSDIRIITFDPCDVIFAHSCFVITNRPQAFGLNPFNRNVIVRPELILFTAPDKSKPAVPIDSSAYAYDVFLKRIVNPAGPMIYVDKQVIYPAPTLGQVTGQILYLGRCVTDWHVVYQTLIPDTGTLGFVNNIPTTLFPEHNFSFFLPNPFYPRGRFITVGDIPRVLTLGHDITPDRTIGEQLGTKLKSEEHLVRLDLQNPFHRNIFQYLTVFDPVRDFIDNDGDGLGIDGNGDGFLDSSETDLDEVKIPGRININTAPWYVIAQLPWVSQRINPPLDYSLAQTIIAYRDKLPLPVDHTIGRYNAIIANSPLNDNFAARFAPWTVRENPGFASIGELNFVIAGINNFNVGLYSLDTIDLPGFPDLTTYGPASGDGLADDFEERDVIFSRISNLVSVRSDVFTAYILVRIGADGPQKRAVAILDRSGIDKTNFRTPDGKVRIVSLHYVPEPR